MSLTQRIFIKDIADGNPDDYKDGKSVPIRKQKHSEQD
jgi:hypothetical protein